jgi:3beta-hydroxy-delta5-steroid dehydrogenase/steroid delta-isomerase
MWRGTVNKLSDKINYADITAKSATPVLPSPRQLGVCLLTGAAGFLGDKLLEALLQEGVKVRALIYSRPLQRQHPNLQLIKGDIVDAAAMHKACEGIDTIFHTAARINLMGGRHVSDSYRQEAWHANVNGSRTLLDAAVQQGCKRMVYTSSIDVCFDGAVMEQMDESLPYAARPQSVYGESKIEAEKSVLQASGKAGLHTCALRPAGIYGGSANVMIDRFLQQLLAGTLKVGIGAADVRTDTSQVDNLVHAQLLAALHLVEGGVACGQAYFINDNAVMNPFAFFRPIIEGLGYRYPRYTIPAGLIRPFLSLQQALHFRAGLPAPMLSPHELDKISVTHWATNEKARRQLGYQPVKTYEQAMDEVIAYCREVVKKNA